MRAHRSWGFLSTALSVAALLTAVLSGADPAGASNNTIRVPQDYASIQTAVAAAAPGERGRRRARGGLRHAVAHRCRRGGRDDALRPGQPRNTLRDNRYFGIVIKHGDGRASDNRITGGRIGIAVVADAVDTVGVLQGDRIRGATVAPVREIACCGYTATAVVKR